MNAAVHPSLSGPLQAFEHVRRDLLAVLREVPPTSWVSRSSSQAWSVGEHADHLIRAEIGTSKMAHKLIRGDFQHVIRPDDALYFDSRLTAYPYGRLAAPSVLEPTTIARDEAEGQFVAVHRRFVEELALFQGPDADALAAPDPATGAWFTLAGWVRLQALHEAHHIQQIRELRTT